MALQARSLGVASNLLCNAEGVNKPRSMNTASSPPPAARPSTDAMLHTLERLGAKRPEPRTASGIYRSVDEFAGLDRLDRAELDETDEG